MLRETMAKRPGGPPLKGNNRAVGSPLAFYENTVHYLTPGSHRVLKHIGKTIWEKGGLGLEILMEMPPLYT